MKPGSLTGDLKLPILSGVFFLIRQEKNDKISMVINMLKIENLTKKYGDKKAVDNLSLHIEKGEIYGFIGHNGAGKTTTIKSCCGILSFDEGEIYIDGISVKANPIECKRMLAYIPDNPELYDFMTGIQFLNFVADVFGVSASVRQEKIRKYADLFGLTSDLSQQIKSYSHGMKQKLAVISALIHSPKLVIMDEPTSSLDISSRDVFIELIKKLNKELGIAFLIIIYPVPESNSLFLHPTVTEKERPVAV